MKQFLGIDLWLVELASFPAACLDPDVTLSLEERQRAQAYRFEAHRRRFISRRLALRMILSQYLGFHPADIKFACGPFGKPGLAAGCLPAGQLNFSTSHSLDCALIAVSLQAEVGVDIERHHEDVDWSEVARTQFAPGEHAALVSLPEAQRRQAFFDGWTRKEAYVKAIGLGLSMPLDAFEVSLTPDQPPRLLRDDRDPQAPARWAIHDLPAAGFSAALVAPASTDRIMRREWRWPTD